MSWVAHVRYPFIPCLACWLGCPEEPHDKGKPVLLGRRELYFELRAAVHCRLIMIFKPLTDRGKGFVMLISGYGNRGSRRLCNLSEVTQLF